MSRSSRKTPIMGFCSSKGQKRFKQQEHRRERRAVRVALHTGQEIMPHHKKYGNEWDSPRDGKYWFGYLKYGYSYLDRLDPDEAKADLIRYMRK